MKLGTQDDIIETVRAIGPVIRDHADEGERQRRPARATLDVLREAGLCRLYAPRSLGGLEVDPITCALVVEEAAGFDSAAGWTVMIANVMDWFCARLPDAGAEEIYVEGPDTITAVAFNPPMQAVEVEGGYRVRGRNALASNVHEASWVFVPALVMEAGEPRLTNGESEVIGAFLAAGECEVVDTWYALGMRGTDSNDVAVEDVFVPSSRTFPLVPEFEPGTHYQTPLYRMPAMGAVVAVWGGIALAIARGAIAELVSLAATKTPLASATTLAQRPSAQGKLGKAEALLRSARALLYESLGEAWERTLAGGPSSLEQRGDLLMAAIHAVQSSAQATELMYEAAGTSGIYTRSPLERHFRDMQVFKQHGFFSQSRYETVGQAHLGLPPDLDLFAF